MRLADVAETTLEAEERSVEKQSMKLLWRAVVV